MKKKLNCILLIDDDEPTNFISSMMIEEVACAKQIQIAQSGQAALDYLNSSGQLACQSELFPCPDLIFLDINMPAMNGWEFLEKYSKLERQIGEIIIVMLTTSINPDDELRAKEISVISGFENKPLTSGKLNRILREYFPSYFFKSQSAIYNQ